MKKPTKKKIKKTIKKTVKKSSKAKSEHSKAIGKLMKQYWAGVKKVKKTK